MRKTLLPLFMLLMCSMSYAQIEKGDVLVGGFTTFSSSTFNDDKNSFFQFSPRVGFFVSDRTSIGPVLSYQVNTSEQATNGPILDARNSLFSFGAFMRNYKPISEKFYFYLHSSVTYGTGNRKFEGAINDEGDQSQFNINISPGFSFFATDRLALDVRLATATFRSESFDNVGGNGETEVDSFFLSGGLSNVGFGISWFLK